MTKKLITAAAAGLTAALLLTSCSTGPAPVHKSTQSPAPTTQTATPTPSDEPVDAPAPKSEEDAVKHAKKAVDTFLIVRAEIENDHPDDVSKIKTVATGDAKTFVKKFAHVLVKDGSSVKGKYEYEPWDGWEKVDSRTVDDKKIKYGHVSLTGCFDSSDITNYDKDGKKFQGNSTRRGVMVATVIYDAEINQWLVAGMDQPEDEVEEC